MTRILLLIQHLADGGAQRVATLWAQFLQARGLSVTVVTFYPRADEYPLLNTANTQTTNKKASSGQNLVPKTVPLVRVNLLDSFAAFQALKNPIQTCQKLLEAYLAAHPQDILIPLSFKANLVAASCDQTHVKVVTQTVRNSPWSQEQGFDRGLRDWAIRKQGSVILQNAEQLLYFTTAAFDKVQKFIVHNPLHPAISQIYKQNYHEIRRIIAIGRLVPQKNHRLMLETMQVLRDAYGYDCELDIYGVGPEQMPLTQLLTELNLQDRVRLCGRATNIFDIAVNYDLFLMTSWHEGTPNALLEAMGLGLPVMTTAFRTGPKELINNRQNGLIILEATPAALAQAIIAHNDPAFLAQIGRQARRDMQRYAPENSIAELLDCIQTLLRGC